MDIAQVSFRYYPYIGGVEEHVRNISERLAKENNVSVLTTDSSGKLRREETLNGVKIRRFSCWAPNDAYYFSAKLKAHLKAVSSNFDIVHAHNYACFPALYAAQAKDRNKFVFTPHYHGLGSTCFRSLLHVPYRLLGRRIFEKADRIVCVSRHEKSLVTRNFGMDEEKIVIIPNGVNLQEFEVLRRKREHSRKDRIVILYVGRLEEYKGVQYLVRVLPKLGSNAMLEIVGKGPYEEKLHALVRKLNVDDQVEFFKDLPRTKLLQKYFDADVFALLSKYEAYSISVAEALAARVPCVVARTSALRQWIDDVNCFGIDYPMNVDGLAALISNAVGTSVCKTGILDWNEVAEKTASLYGLLLGS